MMLLIVASTVKRILSRRSVSAMAQPPAVIALQRDPTPPHPAVPDFVAVLPLCQVIRNAYNDEAWMFAANSDTS